MTVLIIILAGGVLVGCLQESLRQAILAPIHAFEAILQRGWLALGSAATVLRHALARLLVDIDLDGGRFRTTYLLGAVIETLAWALFTAGEGLTVALSMQALGLGEAVLPHALAHSQVSSIISATVLGAGLYAAWAYKIFEEGAESHLVVTQWYTTASRRLLRRGAAAAFVLVGFAVLGLAILRAAALGEGDTPLAIASSIGTPPVETAATGPSPFAFTALVGPIRFLVSCAAALALLAVAAISWTTGPMALLRFLPILGVAMARVLVAVVRWVLASVHALIRGLDRLVSLFFDALFGIATPLARIPAEMLRRSHRWAEATQPSGILARTAVGLVASVTAVGEDLQVPRLPPGPSLPAHHPSIDFPVCHPEGPADCWPANRAVPSPALRHPRPSVDNSLGITERTTTPHGI